MAIDFPTSPSVGQQFTAADQTWQWDGTAWSIVPAIIPPSWPTALARNRVVNSAFQHSQELGDVGTSTDTTYFMDQWRLQVVGPVCGAAHAFLATPSPSGNRHLGFLNVTTPKPSLAAGDYMGMVTLLEGVHVADFDWGSIYAKPVVLRFSVRSPIAGTFCVAIRNAAYDRSFVASYSISAAEVSVMVDKTIVIPGDVTGTWPTTTALGLSLFFVFACGTTFQGVAGWQAGSKFGLAGITNGAAATNIIHVTDVGLYLDPDGTGLAPPFEVPDYADELRACQRYWRSAPVQGNGYLLAGQQSQALSFLPVAMRTSPTFSVSAAGTSNNATTINISVDATTINLLLTATAAGMCGVFNRSYNLTARM